MLNTYNVSKSYTERCLISYTMHTKEIQNTIQYIFKKCCDVIRNISILFFLSAGDCQFLNKTIQLDLKPVAVLEFWPT